MSDLTEFLLARIAEDYADAMSGWRWKSLPTGEYERLQARVLAECEAKKAIVEEHHMMSARRSNIQTMTIDGEERAAWVEGCCSTCTAGGEFGGCNPMTGELDYCPTLRALAAVYADHPDYDEAWRP